MSVESGEAVLGNEAGAAGATDTSGAFARGSIFFVGTATVVLRYAGFTILTDPNFLHSGDHVHLGYGLTSERLTDPAVEIDALPPLDLCVLSHLHGDHFDRIAEERLNKSLPIVTTRHAAASLRRKGFEATHGLDTWETFTATKGGASLRITSMPGQHGPGRIFNALLPPVMGSMLEFTTAEGATPLRLYITGDTLIHEDLREIPRRFPDIDIALLHLGGTRVFGVMLTMDAKQGVEAIKLIRPQKAVPIHYNDYTVFKSPLRDFKRAVRRAGLEDRVVYLSHGETYEFEVPASRLERREERPALVGADRGSQSVRRQPVERPARVHARRSGGSNALAILGALGAGAAMIYLLDPRHGERRRSQLRDKLAGFANSLAGGDGNDAGHG